MSNRLPGKRAATATAILALLMVSAAAAAQTVTQTLTLTLSASDLALSVPLDGWTVAAIALLLAGSGALFLRRRARGGFGVWPVLAIGAATLISAQSIGTADAKPFITSLILTTTPAQVSFVFPGAPSFNEVVATNNTAANLTITGISLGPGPYSLSAGLVGIPCVVGLKLPPGGQCSITLQIIP